MNPWSLLRHERTVRRTHDWQRFLGASYAEWAFLLQPIEDPVGRRFLADFGSGEAEYELARDDMGFVALAAEGVTPHRLNATEAEFARVDMLQLLTLVGRSAVEKVVVEPLAPGGPYSLGKRVVGGRSVILLAAPRGLQPLARERCRHTLRNSGSDAALVLASDALGLLAAARDELTAARIAVSDLPSGSPWQVDWSPLVDPRFQIPFDDPVFFFGVRHAVIVDVDQQRIWLEGHELKVKADGQSYRLLAHLAERVGTAVPTKVLANQVLEAGGDRPEAKIVSDAKSELMKAIKACLTPTPDGARLDATTLVQIEDGRARLNVDASLVKVVRRLSEHRSP